MSVPCDKQYSFCQDVSSTECTPANKILHILASSLPLQRYGIQSSWVAVSQTRVLSETPNKTQILNSHGMFFFRLTLENPGTRYANERCRVRGTGWSEDWIWVPASPISVFQKNKTCSLCLPVCVYIVCTKELWRLQVTTANAGYFSVRKQLLKASSS